MKRGTIIAPHRSERRRITRTLDHYTSGSYTHDISWVAGDIPHVRNVRIAKNGSK